jgi:iron complex transport system substrate-binding protein
MKKTIWNLGIIALLIVVMTACSSKAEVAEPKSETSGTATTANTQEAATTSAETKTIKYLDTEYTIPAKSDRIVITGSMESMEDAVVLGVQPVGAISVGGKFPDLFKAVTGSSQSSGEKMQPNFEGILNMKPDVILSSTKAGQEVHDKLGKIATDIPVSHISTNWEANLRLLAELTGTQDKADQALQQYQADLDAARAKLSVSHKDKKIVAVRVRAGNIYIYPEKVFFNPSLYSDIGFTAPDEVKAAKAQEMMTLEKFSEMNPDYIFVQFAEDENKETPKIWDEIQNNPIWKSINAAKNRKVFVNVVDPLAQGGTAYSKISFLKAAVEKLSN